MTQTHPDSGALDRVRERLAAQPGPLTAQRVAAALRLEARPVGDVEVQQVHRQLVRDTLGAGVLEPLLRDPEVTDVLVNGCDAVYVDRGRGLELAPEIRFADEAEVRRLAQRLAASGLRRIDDATPWCDVRLRDGTRFHAVLDPLARPGTLISLRVPRQRGFTVDDLAQAGAITREAVRVLGAIVEARLAFLISGGTGTGKTTLLSALLAQVDSDERLVIVEDASELRPDHPHVVALEARPANAEGAGEIDLRVLVRQALRMRPDRLVVGECRGAEVIELLAALNTGHEGGCGTIHANAAGAVPARIEALALSAGLPREAAHSQLASALQVVLHLVRDRDGRRRLAEVAVPIVDERGLVAMLTAVQFDADGRASEGPGAAQLGEALAVAR